MCVLYAVGFIKLGRLPGGDDPFVHMFESDFLVELFDFLGVAFVLLVPVGWYNFFLWIGSVFWQSKSMSFKDAIDKIGLIMIGISILLWILTFHLEGGNNSFLVE